MPVHVRYTNTRRTVTYRYFPYIVALLDISTVTNLEHNCKPGGRTSEAFLSLFCFSSISFKLLFILFQKTIPKPAQAGRDTCSHGVLPRRQRT